MSSRFQSSVRVPDAIPIPRAPRWRIPFSLRWKLLIALALILLPSLILVIAADLNDLALRRESVLTADRTTADTVANLVDATVDDAVAVGQAIATAPSTATFNPQIIDARLMPLAQEYLQFQNIVVVNERGDSVGEMVPYPPDQPRVNVADRPYFRQTMAFNSVQVSPILIGRRLGRPTAIISVPIRDRAGRPIGAVLVALNLEYFRAKLWSVPLGEGQVIIITDPLGQLAFDSSRWELGVSITSLADAPLISEAIHGSPATQESGPFPGLEGSQIGAAVPSPRYHWVVAVLQPVAVAEAPINRVILIDVASFALAAALGTLAILYLSQQIVAPILELDRAAREWSDGNLGVRVSIRTGDELEHLANSLDDMAASLQRTLQQLSETDRRLTEERNRLRAILETSPAGIIMMSADGAIVLANSAAEAFLGERLAPGTPVADTAVIHQLYKPDGTQYPYDQLPLVRAFREGTPVVGSEIVVRRPNGWEVRLLTNAAPLLRSDGTILGSVAVFFDITPIAEEERLRREFVVSAAHEFRHPLTVIKGYAEVAMRNPIVRDTAVCSELGMIVDAADRANDLANQLLKSAQVHIPPVLLHREPVDLARLVKNTVEHFAAELPPDRYRFNFHGGPAEVDGDPQLLSEAVVDMLRQAVAAMPSGGTIDIEVSAWDGIATASVSDHGPQVLPEAIPFLFRPFGVVPSPATPSAVTRPSLPLYLARRIIEESGGWIRAESSPTTTTISFSLPRRAHPTPTSNRPATGPDSASISSAITNPAPASGGS